MSSLWRQLHARTRAWAIEANETWLASLSRDARGGAQRNPEARVVLFGPTQVGKTTLLLTLLGIRDDAAAEVETVLRGGRVHGQSSTALPMRYLRSRDNQWRIDTADTPGLSAEAVRAHLGTVRAAVEDGRHQSTDPVTLFLPADHFAVGEPAVRVSVLDLPGIAAAAPRERLLVERIARRHLPAASLILLVGHASKLGMLDPVALGRQLEELKGWMRSRLRYRLVLTYTFDQESMERRFKDMPDLEAVRAHFVEQIGLFGFPVEPTLSKRLYPLDFGKSWSDQLAKPGAYRDWAAAVRAQGLHALEEDIARSCEGDTRLRISQEVGEQTVWRVEMLRQERTDALTAARNDLRRGRAKVQVVQRTKTRWERRLDDATKARDTLNAALAGIEAVVRTQVTAIPIAVSYAPDGTLTLMDEEGKPVLPHVDALTAWLQADQDKLVDACECIARTLSERAGLHPPVAASECVEAMKQAYDAQCAQLGAGKYWTWLSGQFAEDCQRLQKAALERRRVIVRTLPAQLRDAVREERSRRARRQRQAVVRCSNLDKLKLRLTAKLADSRADFRRTWNDLRQKRDALRHDQKRLADFDAHMAQGYAAESLTIGKRIIAATYEGNAAVVLANLCGLRLARQTHLLICPNAA